MPADPGFSSGRDQVVTEAFKLARAAGFLRQRVEATRALLVTMPPSPRLDGLLQRLQKLEDAVRQAELLAQTAAQGDPAAAMIKMKSFDYTGMMGELRWIDSEIAAMGPAPGAQAASPRPLSTGSLKAPGTAPGTRGTARPLTGQLADRLKSLVGLAPTPRALPAQVLPPAKDRVALETLEAALRFVSDVLGYVGPRLVPVACALDVYEACAGQPMLAMVATARKAAAQRVPEEGRGWVPALVKLFSESPEVRKPARVATTQWDQLRTMHGEATAARAEADQAPPAQRTGLLLDIKTAKLRGAALPLANLHLTFAGVPHLKDLFPPLALRK